MEGALKKDPLSAPNNGAGLPLIIGGDVNIAYEFKVLPEQSRRNIMMENAVRFYSLDV